jgi:hypothetical protein
MCHSGIKSELKISVEKRLDLIANVLLINASFIENPGLLNGKMGIAIFFYHYAKYPGKKIYEEYACALIDEIYEEIDLKTPVDFANGLIGIGWGINYLIQNGYVEADTDEIMEDINKTVFQKILLDFDQSELHGNLLYLLPLLKAKKKGNDKKGILYNRTLLCLFKKCEYLLGNHKSKEQNASPDLFTLTIIRCFLLEINKTGAFPGKTKKLLDFLPPLIKIATAGKDSDKETIVDRATTLAWQQLVNPLELGLGTDLQSVFHQALEFIDDEENWNYMVNKKFSNNWGLNKGLAGIGIILLRILGLDS